MSALQIIAATDREDFAHLLFQNLKDNERMSSVFKLLKRLTELHPNKAQHFLA